MRIVLLNGIFGGVIGSIAGELVKMNHPVMALVMLVAFVAAMVNSLIPERK